MMDIEVTIPGDRRKFPPRERPIMTLRALRDHGRRNDETLNYTHTPSGLLDINQKNGDVTFSKIFREKENDSEY